MCNFISARSVSSIVSVHMCDQGFERRLMSVELIFYVKTQLIENTFFYELRLKQLLLFFINFTTSFVGGILWWTDRVMIIYSNLCNTTNLNRVIFTHWKHLQSWVNALWYYFQVIKRYDLHYLMKLPLTPRNQSFFEILQLFNIWCYQSLVILFFSSVVILI